MWGVIPTKSPEFYQNLRLKRPVWDVKSVKNMSRWDILIQDPDGDLRNNAECLGHASWQTEIRNIC